jgi:hypothetical protein
MSKPAECPFFRKSSITSRLIWIGHPFFLNLAQQLQFQCLVSDDLLEPPVLPGDPVHFRGHVQSPGLKPVGAKLFQLDPPLADQRLGQLVTAASLRHTVLFCFLQDRQLLRGSPCSSFMCHKKSPPQFRQN